MFIAGLAKAVLPTEYVDKVRHKLVIAGRGQPEESDRFLVVRVLSVVAIPVLWYVVWKFTSLTGTDTDGRVRVRRPGRRRSGPTPGSTG